jgi:hypothetical protein
MVTRTRRWFMAIATTAALVVGILAVESPAGAAAAANRTAQSSTAGATAQGATGTVRVQDRTYVVAADLANKINSGDWLGLSAEQLAGAGIHPDMPLPDGTRITATLNSQSVVPDSASGCSQRVCIYVFGSGLHVDDWDTSATNASYLCTYSGYWTAGVLTGTSNVVCGSSGQFWAYWTPLRYYINGTRLCNTWLHLAGKPCETVHS